jgi:malonate transporter
LILGCAAGLLYTNIFKGFPPFIDNILQLSASVTLPLALLSIGGSLTLKTLKTYLGAATTAAGIKLVALPLLGWAMLRLWSVEGLFFQVGLIFFALPASTAIYVLSSQLNSDTELASATIALSTLLSAVSLSMVLGLLHE